MTSPRLTTSIPMWSPTPFARHVAPHSTRRLPKASFPPAWPITCARDWMPTYRCSRAWLTRPAASSISASESAVLTVPSALQSTSPSDSRREILVVDDDRKTVDLLRLYLERAGFSVSSAHDGQSALDLARSRTFDL